MFLTNMNNFNLSEEELAEINWFLSVGQNRYRLLMELYNLSLEEMQSIVDNFYAHSIGP